MQQLPRVQAKEEVFENKDTFFNKSVLLVCNKHYQAVNCKGDRSSNKSNDEHDNPSVDINTKTFLRKINKSIS